MSKKILCIIALVLVPMVSWAGQAWEKKDNFYFLAKNRDNFALEGAGPNVFASKYLRYNGVDFLVRAPGDWKDYGRLNLEKNNMFSLPIRPGVKVGEIDLLAGGNYSNSYEHDSLMRLFGDKYFYATLSVIFIYEDGICQELSVPVFWDWFSVGIGTWSKGGATIKSLGENPVRQKCSIFHINFVNPRPEEPIKNILVTDSWIDDRPFSDVFAVTLKSSDTLDAIAREDK
ncbi:MAG: hypothetical protein PHO40_07155 [Candidatus Omnitrophica bacterium]|jgi:hypothetical protein|nr:hypothetical protein [Candidatus Omnitrophota bacterium]